jgi:hypothetical protein
VSCCAWKLSVGHHRYCVGQHYCLLLNSLASCPQAKTPTESPWPFNVALKHTYVASFIAFPYRLLECQHDWNWVQKLKKSGVKHASAPLLHENKALFIQLISMVGSSKHTKHVKIVNECGRQFKKVLSVNVPISIKSVITFSYQTRRKLRCL